MNKLLYIAYTGQLTFGFGELDFTDSEPDSVMVSVSKTGANAGDLIINVTPMTYNQLESMNVPIPEGIREADRPDPAECGSI